MKQYFIIDFDSTFTQVEALDLLAEISIQDKENKNNVIDEIKKITDKGMGGGMSFQVSLKKRIALLTANKQDLLKLINQLKPLVSPSFKRNTSFINNYKNHIYIVSNGFKDFIIPVVSDYGIKEKNVFANEFLYDENENIIGFNENNLLSKNNGKSKQIASLNLDGEVFVIGDGYTDLEIKKAGLVNKFYAFTENIKREKVIQESDHETPSLLE